MGYVVGTSVVALSVVGSVSSGVSYRCVVSGFSDFSLVVFSCGVVVGLAVVTAANIVLILKNKNSLKFFITTLLLHVSISVISHSLSRV